MKKKLHDANNLTQAEFGYLNIFISYLFKITLNCLHKLNHNSNILLNLIETQMIHLFDVLTAQIVQIYHISVL